jgi:uncharacterized membrane protein YgcG
MMKKDLWLRLRNYQFEDIVPTQLWDRVSEAFGGADASTRAFASKIARKHGWSTRYALRAIDEYRKFVFLGVTGDVIVTPSKAIDTVWHEHLLFTRAYRDFCRDVLGRDFDHNPELLPTAEQTTTFAQQFEATLERYRAEFHVNPPHDIWGTPKFKWKGPPPRANTVSASSDTSDLPLYLYFDGSSGTSGHSDMPEFSGDSGGGFSGGGGGSDWGSSDSSDSGGSGDSGGSDGGGSGCSSGCGGGGD